MSGDLITEITIFVLAVFVGFEVISKVPTMLHTPLMSGTNAIHGIVLLGGILVVGAEGADTLVKLAGTVAVAFGTINIVGGFLVTDRMLEMFKGRGARSEKGARSASGEKDARSASGEKGARSASGSGGSSRDDRP
jgi:NAD(P) transhydrogenase subunit alpha